MKIIKTDGVFKKAIVFCLFTSRMVELWSQSKQRKGNILVHQCMIMGNYRY